jgi:transposase-like protein
MSDHSSTALQGSVSAAPAGAADTEVVAKAVRRRFTAEYKLRILQEAEVCTQPGELGALLRREGLYSSHLTTWRKQREQGALQGLAPAKRGRKADPQAGEIARLKRENERLKSQLERAALIIDVQKKVSQMLDATPTESDGAK